ncbi:hypothetical protein PAXRUDRAFT_88313, partial [Paxillus rubicundulus Ve08.2h10]
MTICADGDSIAPTIIYKGQSLSTNWHQDNALKVFNAHLPKGWTDGEIGWQWIEDFNKKTCLKANATGHNHLLLIDGHNLHYTKDFLDYVRQNNIHILCYPAHTIHIYQGLNVVIFSPPKQYWTIKRDLFQNSTHQKITKANFISIYEKAHQKALTPENDHLAFKQTGVWPLNPDVVTGEMMASSLETSSHGQLPLPLPSPVR